MMARAPAALFSVCSFALFAATVFGLLSDVAEAYAGGHIKSKISGKNLCIDIPGHNYAPGQTLQVWSCGNGQNQKFVYNSLTKQISSGNHVGLCISLNSGSNGALPAELQNCDATKPEQAWTFQDSGIIQNDHYGKCIDIWSGSNNGQAVKSYPCHSSENQQWVSPIHKTFGMIKSEVPDTNLCIVVPNNDFAQGKVLKVNECRGGHDQQFRYNENTQQLSAGHNNLCIQILHQFDGSPISLYPCDSTKAEQKWDFLGDGRIYNQRYNKCVRIPSSQADGSRLFSMPCQGGQNGEWSSGITKKLNEGEMAFRKEDGPTSVDIFGPDNKCLKYDGESNKLGWEECQNNFVPSHQFSYDRDTEQFMSLVGRKCITHKSNGSARMETCDEGRIDQKWVYVSTPRSLLSRTEGKCLNVIYWVSEQNQGVEVTNCGRMTNWILSMARPRGALGHTIMTSNGLCLHVPDFRYQATFPVLLDSPCWGFHFQFNYNATSHQIRSSAATDLCVALDSWGLKLMPCNENDSSQRFSFVVEDGVHRILHDSSGKFLYRFESNTRPPVWKVFGSDESTTSMRTHRWAPNTAIQENPIF